MNQILAANILPFANTEEDPLVSVGFSNGQGKIRVIARTNEEKFALAKLLNIAADELHRELRASVDYACNRSAV